MMALANLDNLVRGGRDGMPVTEYVQLGHVWSVMQTVNIAELKNRLSHYLRLVQDGNEIIVRDRRQPIARLMPLSPDELDADEASLIATGQMRLPSAPLPPSFWEMQRPRVAARAVVDALEADREG